MHSVAPREGHGVPCAQRMLTKKVGPATRALARGGLETGDRPAASIGSARSSDAARVVKSSATKAAAGCRSGNEELPKDGTQHRRSMSWDWPSSVRARPSGRAAPKASAVAGMNGALAHPLLDHDENVDLGFGERPAVGGAGINVGRRDSRYSDERITSARACTLPH